MVRTPRLLTCLLVAALLVPRPARASVWDGDIAMVSQLIAILSQLEQSYRTLKSQLDQLETTVKLAKDSARQLTDIHSFSDLQSFISSVKGQYQNIRSQADGIKFEVDTVRGQFDTLFPGAKRIPTSELYQRQSEWYQQTSNSARMAMAGQAVFDNADSTSKRVSTLMGYSSASSSQIQQLQVMNQLLATLAAQVSELTRMLALSNRAVSTQIATKTAEDELLLEHSRSAWDTVNYCKPSAPASTLRALPRVGSP